MKFKFSRKEARKFKKELNKLLEESNDYVLKQIAINTLNNFKEAIKDNESTNKRIKSKN